MERVKRADDALNLIGLGGFASAYPKDYLAVCGSALVLQRALVVYPDLLSDG